MSDTRNPPGYVPLTIHELTRTSGNTSQGARSQSDRDKGNGSSRNGGRSSSRGSRDRSGGSSGPRKQQRPRRKQQ